MSVLYINFYIKEFRTKKDGTAPVYMRFTLGGQRREVYLGHSISPSKWDSDKGRAKGSSSEALRVNSVIQASHGKLVKTHSNMEAQGPVTATQLRDRYLGKTDDDKVTVIEYFKRHNKRCEERVQSGDLSQASLTKYETVLSHTEDFVEQHDCNSHVDKIDIKFIEDFHHFLRTKKDISHNVTVKYIRALGRVLKQAKRAGLTDKVATENYDRSIKKKDPVHLVESELHALEVAEIDNESLSRIRDYFLFSCYTGFAYIDVRNLKTSDIIYKMDGSVRMITLPREKTDVTSRVALLRKAEQIIDKYSEWREKTSTDSLFPIPSNQKVNEYLKVIASISGIDKKLTFHVARHTFATTVTLANGVDLKTVSEMLGHSSIKMTEHYAKLVDRKIIKDMSELQDKLDQSPVGKHSMMGSNRVNS